MITQQNSVRVPALLKSYGFKLISMPEVDFHFVNYGDSLARGINIKYSAEASALYNANPNHRGPNWRPLDMLAKLYDAMRHFICHTNSLWFYRGTDDTFINPDRLLWYLSSLHADPLAERVIKGHCAEHENRTFLHGGGGFLMSRKAVETVWPYMRKIVTECNDTDEMCFQQVLNYNGLSLFNASSSHFSGNFFDTRLISFNNLPICPDPLPVANQLCDYGVSKLNELVFFHQMMRSMEDGDDTSKRAFNAPNEVYMYHTLRHPTVCVKKSIDYDLDKPISHKHI